MLAFYQAAKAQYPCSINDVIVLACAALLKEFPAFRSRIEGDEFVESPASQHRHRRGHGRRAGRAGAVGRRKDEPPADRPPKPAGWPTRPEAGKIEGMGLGSFTITNLGMFGTEEFAAIINPPEAAILAVGAAREAVIVKDGSLRAGKLMTMTLSADHRIIDGMLAAKFLARMKESSNPQGLSSESQTSQSKDSQ